MLRSDDVGVVWLAAFAPRSLLRNRLLSYHTAIVASRRNICKYWCAMTEEGFFLFHWHLPPTSLPTLLTARFLRSDMSNSEHTPTGTARSQVTGKDINDNQRAITALEESLIRGMILNDPSIGDAARITAQRHVDEQRARLLSPSTSAVTEKSTKAGSTVKPPTGPRSTSGSGQSTKN